MTSCSASQVASLRPWVTLTLSETGLVSTVVAAGAGAGAGAGAVAVKSQAQVVAMDGTRLWTNSTLFSGLACLLLSPSQDGKTAIFAEKYRAGSSQAVPLCPLVDEPVSCDGASGMLTNRALFTRNALEPTTAPPAALPTLGAAPWHGEFSGTISTRMMVELVTGIGFCGSEDVRIPIRASLDSFKRRFSMGELMSSSFSSSSSTREDQGVLYSPRSFSMSGTITANTSETMAIALDTGGSACVGWRSAPKPGGLALSLAVSLLRNFTVTDFDCDGLSAFVTSCDADERTAENVANVTLTSLQPPKFPVIPTIIP